MSEEAAVRLRHGLYKVFVVVVFVPFVLLAGASRLFEQVDDMCGRVRRWCYRERYAPRARKPGAA